MPDTRHAVFTVDNETKLNGLGVGAPAGTRTLTAGAGLTGGGDLTADRTFDIVATDGTITVGANSIGVGTVPAGQVSGLASIATSGSASDLSAGTVPTARMPAQADVGAMTSNGVSADRTLVDVTTTGVSDPAKVNANFDDVADMLNDIRTALRNAGVMS